MSVSEVNPATRLDVSQAYNHSKLLVKQGNKILFKEDISLENTDSTLVPEKAYSFFEKYGESWANYDLKYWVPIRTDTWKNWTEDLILSSQLTTVKNTDDLFRKAILGIAYIFSFFIRLGATPSRFFYNYFNTATHPLVNFLKEKNIEVSTDTNHLTIHYIKFVYVPNKELPEIPNELLGRLYTTQKKKDVALNNLVTLTPNNQLRDSDGPSESLTIHASNEDKLNFLWNKFSKSI